MISDNGFEHGYQQDICSSRGSRLDSERNSSKAVKYTAKELTFSNGSSQIFADIHV